MSVTADASILPLLTHGPS